MADAGDEAPQLTCKFVTKLPEEFRVPQAALTVPSNLTRYGLSQIINHLLELDPPKPFDFLINGELLRGTIQQQLTSQGASVEVVTEIEYLPLQLPPTPGPSVPQDDWIASLVETGTAGGAYYSGSYDGCVRTVEGGEVVRTFQAGPKPVKALVRVPGLGLVTGDGEGRVALWSAEATAGTEAPATRAATLQASGEEVAALAFSPVSGLVAAGGWAKGIRLWASEAVERAQEAAAEAPEVSKKRRGAKGATADAAVETEVETQAVLTGHSGAVSALDWTAEGRLLSGSWDHSARLWDAATESQLDSFSLGKVVYAVACAQEGPDLLAVAGADLAIRLWDPRASGEEAAPLRLRGHQHWVAGLAWHPERAHLLASVSLDGTACLWDARAAIPLHTLNPTSGKLLALAWSGDELAVGGEGKQVHTFTL